MEEKQLENIIREYGGAVKKICSCILNGYSEADIEEAVSDSFVELWRNYDRFDEQKAEVKSYLYGIARKVALNRRRSLARRGISAELDEEQASTENLEEKMMADIDAMILRQLIESMKSPDREIFIKRYFQQESIREIAQNLDLSEKKIENQIARGKKRLKKQLVERGVLA